ncbi:C-5 sterol desaturase [alpha proteobacterium AAP38]|uniref:sterol desaturase family protein n=1 Tax=Niveispirillum sp. TaxID=1917217 RepID=UPI0006B916D8|nr:C-5 sterol desaturase [alpha proteobacterium AAP38]
MPDNLSYPDVATLASPVYLLLLVLELLLMRMNLLRAHYETRDSAASLAMGVGYVITGLFSGLLIGGGISAIMFWVYDHRLFDIGTSVWAIVACFLIDDMRYYWAHRFMHRIRWLWASHVVHHSSQHFNFATALRQPWTGAIMGLFVLKLPLAFLGFHPAILIFASSLNLLYQFWIHTESIRRMPAWFEAVMNTPSHHRVHHGSNPRYLDCNYAGTLIIWDKLFGTFVPEQDDDPVRFGLVRDLGTFNPLRIAFHEFVGIAKDQAQRGLCLRDRFLYLFGPPGWSHDGSRDGTDKIKAAFLRRHPEQAGTPGLPPATGAGMPVMARELADAAGGQ